VREKTRSRVAELAGEVKELKREVRLFPLFLSAVSPSRSSETDSRTA
jgi:hypothetical protein